MISHGLLESVNEINRIKLINEAYYGKKPVEEIEKAIHNIRTAFYHDHNITIHTTKEGIELENAIKKVFGFNTISVYWDRYNEIGPFTIPQAKLATYISYKKKKEPIPFKQQNGYYDKDSVINVVISMPTSAFDAERGLTDGEITAILLHEIGHCFDYSTAYIISEGFMIIKMVNDITQLILRGGLETTAGILNISSKALGMLIKSNTLAKKIYMEVNMLETYIANRVPIIGAFLDLISKILRTVKVIKGLAGNTINLFMRFFPFLVSIPFVRLSIFFSGYKETYADSFATTYGYSTELISGLEKISYDFASLPAIPDNPISKVIIDVNLTEQEFIATCYGGHGTNQERLNKAIRNLEKSLDDPAIPRKLKAQIKDDLKELNKLNNEMIGLTSTPNGDKVFLTIFRKSMDSYYSSEYKSSTGLFGELNFVE